MRIQEVRFQNLNSLIGEWAIDFSAPAYLADGIFAITGPTGAGKTTVLDAVCLALYGRTPRLERVNKSGNEIMSRHTGSCYAEVSFTTRDGSYRCHWSQQRAHKKRNGELQTPKHEISDADTGQVLENKISTVARRVEEITGMDFTRFTRSMLLAQGGFAAFLQAPPDERAPILEQITGTEIYSEISKQVHERKREEETRLGILQLEIGGMKVLSAEEEGKLRESIDHGTAQEEKQREEVGHLRKALLWLEQIGQLEDEIRSLETQWQQYLKRLEAFQENRRRLQRARQAVNLDAPYTQLTQLRKLQTAEVAELEGIRVELPRQRVAVSGAIGVWEKARKELKELKILRKAEGETAKKVRAMDQIIKHQDTLIDEEEEQIRKGETECAALQAEIDNGEQKLKEMAGTLDDIEKYLRENSRDAALVTNLTGITRTFKQLQEQAGALWAKDEQRQQAANVLRLLSAAGEEIAAAYESNKKAQEQQLKLWQAEAEKLNEALQDRELDWWQDELDKYREEKDKLQELMQIWDRLLKSQEELRRNQDLEQQREEQRKQLIRGIEQKATEVHRLAAKIEDLETRVMLLNRIRDLEGERAKLEDGQVCPLCGATEHPYVRGNVPPIDDTQEELNQIRQQHKELNRAMQKQEVQKGRLDKELEHIKTAITRAQLQRDKESILRHKNMDELGVDISLIKGRDEVKVRLDQNQKNISNCAQQRKAITGLQKSSAALAAQYEKSRENFERADKALQQSILQQEQAQWEDERLQKECQSLKDEVNKLREIALQEVSEYGITALPPERLPAILKALNQRKALWEGKQKEKLYQEKAISTVGNEQDKWETRLQIRAAAIVGEGEKLKQQREELRQRQRERLAFYGKRNPDEEEKRLDEKINVGEKAAEKAGEEHEKLQRREKILAEREETLIKAIQNRTPQLQKTEDSFARQLRQTDFKDEEDYLQARLSTEEQQYLSATEEKLKKEETTLQTSLGNSQKNLQREKEKNLTDESYEALEGKRQTGEQELKRISEEIGADKQTLRKSQETVLKLQTHMQEIEEQKQELQRWQILYNLIGSADGKKYRNFAQGLSFDIMIKYANRQLRKMSDRYMLQRQGLTLELNVIDKYQANEVRSTANLSGGESFIVSLALALGLSAMASRKVKVDSLFLDEGFGALSDDVLDTALNTLAELQQEGRLIGLISHVPALKERISTQIQILPQSGGRSRLQGPGCRQISD